MSDSAAPVKCLAGHVCSFEQHPALPSESWTHGQALPTLIGVCCITLCIFGCFVAYWWLNHRAAILREKNAAKQLENEANRITAMRQQQ